MSIPRFELRLDGFDSRSDHLSSPAALCAAIERLAECCSMRLLSTCQVHVGEKGHQHKDRDEYGLSAVGIIATSHIAVHTWPAVGQYMLDIVSCKPFDQERLLWLVKEHLGGRIVVHRPGASVEVDLDGFRQGNVRD